MPARYEASRSPEYDKPLLERYRQPVDLYTRDLLTNTPGTPIRMIEYHLGFRTREGYKTKKKIWSEGKMLRSTLALLTADATGNRWTDAVPAAAAIELFHNFTLIHDDIQDRDETRHGKPTVWSMWGEGQAINAGDAAYLLSNIALLDLQQHDYPPEKIIQAQQLLTASGLAITEGQAIDMNFEKRTAVTIEEYTQMIRKKTGTLIENAIAIGALLGEADTTTTNGLRTYGKNIGYAFQIVDDVLGIWGDPQKTGKPVRADITRRKKSYPIVLALNQARGITKRTLQSFYRNKHDVSDTEVQQVFEILNDLGCKEKTEQAASSAIARAIQALEQTAIDPWLKNDYRKLASASATREF